MISHLDVTRRSVIFVLGIWASFIVLHLMGFSGPSLKCMVMKSYYIYTAVNDKRN